MKITDDNAEDVCNLLGVYLEERFGDNWYETLHKIAELIAEENDFNRNKTDERMERSDRHVW